MLPIDLVTEARLEHAASELSLTDRPILDIALECGFESLSHFYRLLRERKGPPHRYRLRSHAPIR